MPSLIDSIRPPEAEASVTDRLRYLVSFSRKSQARFSRLIGVDPSTLSKILTERMPVTDSFINRVVVNLGVSKDWLVNGRGVPFAKGSEPDVVCAETSVSAAPRGVPVYDVEATAGVAPLSRAFTSDRAIGYLDIPELSTRCVVVRVSGDSMAPEIPNGALIAIREISDTSVIAWGSVYLIELEDYRLVKCLRKNPDPKMVTLRSYNDDYDDIEIPRDKIIKLFLVENIISVNNIG